MLYVACLVVCNEWCGVTCPQLSLVVHNVCSLSRGAK